jgi:hypothetical protein
MSWSIGPDGLNSGETNLYENFPKVYNAGAGGTYGYTNTGGGTGYNSPAYRLCTLNSGVGSTFRARLHKTGDLNYSTLQCDFEIELHCWSNQNTRYNLWVKPGPLNNRQGYFWVTSARELWFWNVDLWSQYGRLIVYEASNLSLNFTTTSNMHTDAQNGTNNWTGQTRQLVDNSTSISIEDNFGSPA